MFAHNHFANILRLASVAALALVLGPAAHASLIPILMSAPVPVVGVAGDFAFNYQIDLGQGARLDPAATSGATCSDLAPCSPAGTFVTIYDVGPLVSVKAPTDWTVSIQMVGMTPSILNGVLPDTTAENVTFMYNGPAIRSMDGVVHFDGFQLVSTLNGTTGGIFSSQYTLDMGGASGTTLVEAGAVSIPADPPPHVATPEPVTFLLIGSGLASLAILGRRRKA